MHPTFAPSVAPTTPAPTLAPTEICQSIKVTVSGTDAVATYNGIYNKQFTTINGYDWWVARNDVGATEATANATIYFSTSHDRWVIEAPDVYWEANMTQHSIGQDAETLSAFQIKDLQACKAGGKGLVWSLRSINAFTDMSCHIHTPIKTSWC